MTEVLDRADALTICFRNLKGPKSKDLLLTAQALQYLKKQPEFGSNQRVGEAVGVSGEIVRQFIGLLDLPASVQLYLAQGMLGLEQGRRLGQLNKSRPETVELAAQVMTSMTAMEARDLTEYLIRDPKASVEGGMEALERARQVINKEYHIDTVLDEAAYRMLVAHAQQRRVRVTDLASNIVNRWLAENDN